MNTVELSTDILVIGSGLASLTAAALLARRGLDVTVIEQHFQPGGSCGTFRRGDRTFDQGTAMLFGFGAEGFNPHRFVMNELKEPITIIKHEHLYRLNYDFHPITFYADMERFFTELEQLFPDDMEGIRAFYAYIGDLYHHVIAADPICMAPSEIPRSEGLGLFLRHPIRNIRLFRLFSQSAGDLMRRFVTSPAVIEFFNKLTSTYCYTTLDETPSIMAVTMFMDNHHGGSYYPVGSSQQLPGKLERSLERSGGYILYQTRAEHILFTDGRPSGIEARRADGTICRITAQEIIYGGTLLNLYGSLIPADQRDPRLTARIEHLIMSYPSVVLYAAVESSVIPPGTYPVEMMADNPRALDEKEITVYAFSIADRSLCPADEHIIMAIGPSLRPWPRPGEPAYQGGEYHRWKQEEEDRLLTVMEAHFPGFRKAVRYSTLATPATIERFVMKERGNVAGPKQVMGQDLLKRHPASTAWDNLFVCGEGTVMGTGSPAVTISGISAANLVLRKRRMTEFRWRPDITDVVETIDIAAPPPRYDAFGRVLPALNQITDPDEILLHDLASACQWCSEPGCTLACPFSYDIRGAMRRIECGNLFGTVRLLREASGSEAIACSTCDAPCEGHCLRRLFDGRSVSIKRILTALERHVSATHPQKG